VIDLERALLSDAVRSDPSRVAALLHPEWFEVDASGRIWNRAELLAAIGPLPHPVDCEVIDAQHVTADEILLLWRSTGGGSSALRTSLWICDNGNWQQRFHQVTPES
jgi:ribonuclease HI